MTMIIMVSDHQYSSSESESVESKFGIEVVSDRHIETHITILGDSKNQRVDILSVLFM